MTRKQLQNDEEINPRLFVDSGALKGLLQTLISNVLEEEVSRHLAALMSIIQSLGTLEFPR